MKIGKNIILTETFLTPAIKPIDDNWGVYTITGYMGSGKTFLGVMLTYYFTGKYKIKTNIRSLEIKGREIEYFTKISDIWNDWEPNVVYLIDEISKKYKKNSPQDAFYGWLQQSRKMGRIVIMITQEWKEVPTWLRRPVRFVYTTHLLPCNICRTTKGDAVYLTLDETGLDWTCPILETYYYKRTKKIGRMYDTKEVIPEL